MGVLANSGSGCAEGLVQDGHLRAGGTPPAAVRAGGRFVQAGLAGWLIRGGAAHIKLRPLAALHKNIERESPPGGWKWW